MNTANQPVILIIDDEPAIRQSYADYLEDKNYITLTAENGKQGLNIFSREKIDLVLIDLRMPEIDGLTVLSKINQTSPEIPLIVASGTGIVGDAIEALHHGAWDYLLKPIEDFSILDHTITSALDKARLQKENREYRKHLETLVTERTMELEKRNNQLEISRRQIIGILSQAAEYRDFETGNHFLRVSEYSACIALGLGWDVHKVRNIQLASPIHDIGKIGVPDGILLKKTNLSDAEKEIMKMHCVYGKNILTNNKFVEAFYCIDELFNKYNKSYDDSSVISMAADIAMSHHEYWNGQGYPNGLKNEEIPIEARITTVADVFDALGSHRPYKDPWPETKCLDYIKKQSGKQFDPKNVEVFLDRIDIIREIKEKYKD